MDCHQRCPRGVGAAGKLRREQCLMLGAKRKTFARLELFRFWTHTGSRVFEAICFRHRRQALISWRAG